MAVVAGAELATRLVMASPLPVVQGVGAVAGVGSREGTTGSGRRPGRALRLLAELPPAPAVALQMLVGKNTGVGLPFPSPGDLSGFPAFQVDS